MHPMNPLIPVFIASPREVEPERQAAEAAIQALAPRFARLFGVTLVPLRWEQFAPISSHDATGPQTAILRRIQPYSIFVGILANRYGSPVDGSSESGTAVEFEHAIKNRGTISILSYFRTQSTQEGLSPSDVEQQTQVNKLKMRLQEEQVWTQSYETVSEFEQRIILDLMEACLGLTFSGEPRKVGDLQGFFRFGSHWRLRGRPLLIVYPPMTDPGPGHKRPRLNWTQRLLPHVIYEDFKAIQDLEEAMRLLGREYHTVTTDSPNLEMADAGDRIWVCVPRNTIAQRMLDCLRSQGVDVRFRFESKPGKTEPCETCLLWRSGDREIQISSPLSGYLGLSLRPATTAEWRSAFGHAYCRDYAVLARFKLMKDPQDERSEYYYHYFVGGIRGLGTWGVGHLIDHNSSQLVRMAQEGHGDGDNVQLLLEVTYEHFRITKVRDVSNEPESFFKERCSTKFIRDKLRRHPGP
jgi:hypothetical protein